MDLWVARQPIFDANTRVAGYELLYRSGPINAFDGSDGNLATARVITAAFYSPAGREIMAHKPAFINFPRELLTNGDVGILPPDEVVIEILENVAPDLDVMLVCHSLRARGYRLALDDFVPSDPPSALTEVANYIKVDFRATSAAQQLDAIRRFRHRSSMVAEKVETQEDFERARQMGYNLFQGYFFARPVIVSTHEIAPSKLHRLRILQQLQNSELDFASLSDLIRNDTGLSYKLLRFVNSALFALRKPVESLQMAMVHIGELGVRRWLTVLLLTEMTADRPDELAVSALARARFCELLATGTAIAHRANDLFLLGLFSHLDAMYGRPMDELLSGLRIHDEIIETLLGTSSASNALAALWQAVLAYEQADWPRVLDAAAKAQIQTVAVADTYASAVRWADRVMRGDTPEDSSDEAAADVAIT